MKSSRYWMNAPELQHLGPEDRARMLQWAQEKAGLFTRHGCIGLIVVVMLLLLLFLALDHFLKQSALSWLVPSIPILLATLFGWYMNSDKHVMQAIRDRLNVQFEARLLPTCWQCGGGLEGVNENATRCPDCGNDQIRGNPTKDAIRRDRFGR